VKTSCLTAILLLLTTGVPTPLYAALTHDNPAQQALENQGMAWLKQTRERPETELSAFVSDGCSGGLSAGWQLLAEHSPRFRQRYGDQPPWEECCVAHDRIYWQGETENGYQLRKQADLALRQCVIDEGEQQAETLAPALEMNPEQVEDWFRQSAELMYVSVRLGGGPCSGLPWRWGFGWPHCTLPTP